MDDLPATVEEYEADLERVRDEGVRAGERRQFNRMMKLLRYAAGSGATPTQILKAFLELEPR